MCRSSSDVLIVCAFRQNKKKIAETKKNCHGPAVAAGEVAKSVVVY